ncbi:MAG: hypothetical protein JHC41_07335 [Nitrosopumilus sp.]|jgi:hypothetical protein|nr:hypothetical protein [Nitrosopumilus sp.]
MIIKNIKTKKTAAYGLLSISMILLLLNTTPAHATITSFTKTPPYTAATTWRYSSTGIVACNPPQEIAEFKMQQCATVSASNGIGTIYAEAWNKSLPGTNFVSQAQSTANTSYNQAPVTTDLTNKYLRFASTLDATGKLYRSHLTTADAYLKTEFKVFRDPPGTTGWGTYNTYAVNVYYAGAAGTITNLDVNGHLYYPVIGPISGKFSMEVLNTAVGVATDAGRKGYADFYNNPLFNFVQVQNLHIHTCDTSGECNSTV